MISNELSDTFKVILVSICINHPLGLLSRIQMQIGVGVETLTDPHPATVFFLEIIICHGHLNEPTMSKSSAEAEYRGVANVASES